MGLYDLGEVIKRTREGMGMTQEELAEGICTQETLSRIETGKRTPNRANFKALMERMGRNGEIYSPYIHAKNYEMMKKWQDIQYFTQSHEFKNALNDLGKFEKEIDLNDRVNRQATMRVKTLCNYYLGNIDDQECRRQLIEALKMTLPHWDEKRIPKGVFTREECGLFCNIATSYMNEGRLEEALVLMRQLQEYFRQTSMDQREKRYSEGLLLSNMAQCLGRNGNTKEALEIVKKEVNEYLKYHMVGRMPNVLYNTAYQMEVQKMDGNACKEKLVQAYYAAEFVGDRRTKKHIRKHFEERYGEMDA